MPYKFNPFTNALDYFESGGGGSSAFFAGEVATYADLPLDGTAALNSRWLVRSSSGTWPFPNYRQGGIYIRTSIVGSSRDNDYTLADTKLPDVFADSAFLLYDNSDSTRNLQFDLGSITTGTTRTLTAPNASGRIQIEGQPIGNTTPAAGTFTTLTANNGTLTASAPVLDLSQTWNNSAVAFTTFRINVTNAASLFGGSTSNLQDWLVGGTSVAALNASGVISCRGLGTVAGGAITVNGCYGLHGPAGGVMEVRQGTTPIEARFYNTFTSATNHERGFLRWSSNVFQIGTEKGSGGGTARALEFQTDGVTRYTLAATTGQLSSQNSRFVVDDANAVVHVGNTPRISFYGNNVQFLALGNQHDLRWSSTGRSDQASTASLVLVRDADNVLGQRNGTAAQAFRIYNTVSGTNNVNFDRVNFRWASNEFILDAEAGGTGTLRGIKIGSATSSLLGFYGVTPVDQPATVADPAGGGTVDTEARTAVNAIIDRLQELGLIA